MDTRRDNSRRQNSRNYDQNERRARSNDRRDDRNYDEYNSRDYRNPNKRNYEIESSNGNRKKLFIALSVIGALAVAVGVGEVVSNSGKVQIISVQNATVATQKSYQDCQKVGTTRYTKNHKSGTEGAIIGGVGGAAVGALVSHSVVGLAVGAAVGGVGGDLIQRSNEPDYVAHKGSTTQCQNASKTIQVPVGYQVQYMTHDDAISQIITKHQFQAGQSVSIQELENDQVTPAQQKQIVQQASNS
ncbi:MAG: glycine zipper domain-containing protein [Burkholderiales bacterium]|nr:glycine zipper domain-containing protein [Burkholderiales bacterium]